jgi:hypothetical protein
MKKSTFNFIYPNVLMLLAWAFWYRFEYTHMWVAIGISVLLYIMDYGRESKNSGNNT